MTIISEGKEFVYFCTYQSSFICSFDLYHGHFHQFARKQTGKNNALVIHEDKFKVKF